MYAEQDAKTGCQFGAGELGASGNSGPPLNKGQKGQEIYSSSNSRGKNQSPPAWLLNEGLDCPFTELGLLATAGDSKYYTFRVGAKIYQPR